MSQHNNSNIDVLIKEYSSNFNYNNKETAIILAAGHGKRIKSQTSKMLHKIWGKSTVQRVYEACKNGLSKSNSIIVTGIKADDVIKVIGNKKITFLHFKVNKEQDTPFKLLFRKIDNRKYNGTVYILPGDIGLIDDSTSEPRKNLLNQKQI